jgi:hypothetical protein
MRAGSSGSRPGNPDESRLREIEHGHSPHIGQRIRLAAYTAGRAAIPQRDVIRTHPAVALPAVEAGDELILAPMFQLLRRQSNPQRCERRT